MFAITAFLCIVMGCLVVVWSVVETARRAGRRRNAEWTRKASVRAKARTLGRRVPCAACSSKFPAETMTDYGKDAAGKALFLCPPCKKLFPNT